MRSFECAQLFIIRQFFFWLLMPTFIIFHHVWHFQVSLYGFHKICIFLSCWALFDPLNVLLISLLLQAKDFHYFHF